MSLLVETRAVKARSDFVLCLCRFRSMSLTSGLQNLKLGKSPLLGKVPFSLFAFCHVSLSDSLVLLLMITNIKFPSGFSYTLVSIYSACLKSVSIKKESWLLLRHSVNG